MKALFRTAFLLLTAMVGSAILLATLISITVNLTKVSASPAHFLPDNETVLYIPNAHPSLTKSLSKTFLQLKDIRTSEGDIVAIVQGESGSPAVVTFTPRLNTQKVPGSGSMIVGAYSLATSSPLPSTLIREGSNRLHNFTAYKILTDTLHPDVFLKTSLLRKPESLPENILRNLALEKSAELTLTQHPGTIRIRTINQQHGNVEVPNILLLIENPILAFTTVNMASAYKTLLQTLNEAHETALEGIIGAAVSTLFGHDTSVRYDLLPLLAKKSTLQIYSKNKAMNILLEGRVKSNRELAEILERLHTSFAKTLPTSTTVNRVLDKRFSAKDIRADIHLIEEARRTIDGWNIQKTQDQEKSRSLITAYKGNRVLLSTQEHYILKAIKREGRIIELPEEASIHQTRILAGGYAQIASLKGFAETYFPGKVQLSLPWTVEGDTLVWSVEQYGEIRTLTLNTGFKNIKPLTSETQ